MTDQSPGGERTTGCDLCDLPTPDPPVTDPDVDGEFCCLGCLEVTRTLGDVDEAEPEDIRRALGADPDDEPIPDGTEETFLAVEGMHCSTCEAFIEGTAGASEGIHAAEASYASNVVKLTYDPDDIGRDELPGVINGLGYTAREIDEADEGRQETIGRLLVGGFFGMMVMLWYILFLYPTYVGVPSEDLLLDLTGPAGSYLLGNIWVMTSVVLFYTGFPILRGAYVSLLSGHPNMDLLIAIAAVNAYVYSTLAMLVGMVDVYFDIAVVIVVVVTLGNYYEDRLKRKAVGLLSELTEERVDEARIRTGDGTETIPIEAVSPGDTLVVKPGERVPLDGTVVEGTAAVDESLITGESLPVRKEPGDEVIGGGVVTDSALVVAVDEDAGSTLDRLVTLLWDIQSSKPGAQRLADRIAAVFVPLVIVVAVVAFGWQLFTGATPTGALLVGLAVLVVSCPCALGLATPLATASGVHTALDEGIIVGDGSVFETSETVEYVAFDKTGTLTTGEMHVVEATGDDLVVESAAAVEQFSEHPVATAVTAHTSPPDVEVTGFERHPGKGVSAEVDGDRVVVGVPSLVEQQGWTVADDHASQVTAAQEQGNVASVVAWDGASRGVVVAGDTPREEWESVVADLADDGKKVVVITGDSERAAARFRERDDIEHVFAGVPPEAKAQVVERLQADGPTAMVGDGSNDAPALAAADLGIAMESGTALAADAADAIVTTDDLATVPRVFELTAATNGRIKQNLGWAFLYNAIAIPLAVAGAINPLLAAVAMSASSLLVVGNSSRNL